MTSIPKRFIRIWVGGKKDIPEEFENWWNDFQTMHPSYEFLTITDYSILKPPASLLPIINEVKTCAGLSDILRIVSMYQLGGIYVDTDVMPIKSFDELLESDNRPFLAHRSSKSFESAIMGSPKGHPAFLELIDKLPQWYKEHKENSASVQTGPAFVSSVLFGRDDINHLPSKTFYPYNGFGAPKRDEKEIMFKDKTNFPDEMICAHFSNHRWGGKP